MPATQDYTLIQLMRGEKYAVETTIPELGEPLVDLDSGTVYVGNGKDYKGVPINSGTSINLSTPCDLDDQTTWGRYYVEGKVINAPEGMDLYNKFFLDVHGSSATDPTSIFQIIYVVAGDYQDRAFVRSSTDSGKTWSVWSGISGVSFDPNGGGTIAKDPTAGLDKYVLASQNYIESISDGPEGTDGKSGFLLVYRKDLNSPYVYQQLIVLGESGNAGKIYCRLSATNNQDWNSPGYTWREISYLPATTSRAGVVKLSSAVNSTSETLAATPKAAKTAYDKGVEALNRANNAYTLAESASSATTTHATTSVYGTTKLSSATNSTSEVLAATPKAVKAAYDLATNASAAANDAISAIGTIQGTKWVKYVSTKPSTTPSDLPDGGILIVG